MATETNYNVIKVQELRQISSATGADELIINDVDSIPLETKKITAENFAYAIKDYILPIASAEILGGIRVGQGLSINPTNGVLRNDIYYINDLHDVQVVSPKPNQVLTYDGAKWANKEFQGITEIIAGDGLSGGGDNGSVIINVNPGDGISLENDRLNVNAGLGLKTQLDVLLVDNHDSLTFVGNQLAVNPGTAIILDEFGVSVNYGRGLALFGPELEPDLGRGLRFEENEIAARPGFGLGFENADIVLRANLDDLMDVVITNPQFDEILVWDGTNWVNGTPVKCANLVEPGLVRLSTDDEVCSAVNGVDVPSPPEGLCHKVVGLHNVEKLTGCILDLLNFLGDEYSILYCNENVERENDNEPATFVPDNVRQKYLHNINIHGDEPVENLCFRSLQQCLIWLDNRAPVGAARQTIMIIGNAWHPDDQYDKYRTYGLYYKSAKPLLICGTEQSVESRTQNVAYLNEMYINIPRAYNQLEVRDCTLNSGGTPSDPNRPASRQSWGVLLYINSGCVLRNCTLKMWTNFQQAIPLHFRYESVPPHEAYFDFIWDMNYPGTIEIDSRTFGPELPYTGQCDLYMGDVSFRVVHGSNTDQNYFLHKMANTHPNGCRHHLNVCRGNLEIYIYGRGYPRDVKNYGNWKLDWIHNFSGSVATKFIEWRVHGNVRNYIMPNNEITRGRLRSIVQSRGNLNTVYVIQKYYNQSLTNVSDERRGYSTGVADIFGDSFRYSGVPSSSVYNYVVPCYTVYNNAMVSVGCSTISGGSLQNRTVTTLFSDEAPALTLASEDLGVYVVGDEDDEEQLRTLPYSFGEEEEED